MTDSQIVNDKFLIYINSILSVGWISDLFAKDELDAILGGIAGEAKNAGVPDLPQVLIISLTHAYTHIHAQRCVREVQVNSLTRTHPPQDRFNFLVKKMRTNFHVILAFSPVGGY